MEAQDKIKSQYMIHFLHASKSKGSSKRERQREIGRVRDSRQQGDGPWNEKESWIRSTSSISLVLMTKHKIEGPSSQRLNLRRTQLVSGRGGATKVIKGESL